MSACSTCYKLFSTQKAMALHVDLTHAEKTWFYQCSYCGYSQQPCDSKRIKNHLRVVHGVHMDGGLESLRVLATAAYVSLWRCGVGGCHYQAGTMDAKEQHTKAHRGQAPFALLGVREYPDEEIPRELRLAVSVAPLWALDREDREGALLESPYVGEGGVLHNQPPLDAEWTEDWDEVLSRETEDWDEEIRDENTCEWTAYWDEELSGENTLEWTVDWDEELRRDNQAINTDTFPHFMKGLRQLAKGPRE